MREDGRKHQERRKANVSLHNRCVIPNINGDVDWRLRLRSMDTANDLRPTRKLGIIVDHAKRTFIGLDRQTAKADSTPLAPPIRPPWAISEDLFLEACTGCGNCIKVCPENILVKSSADFPIVDFTNGDCTFCEACVDSCDDNAFNKTPEQQAWNHKAIATDSCLAKQGVACQSCQDCCEVRAITFLPRIGGPASPDINHDVCNGCGACFSVCPTDAIAFTQSLSIEPTSDNTRFEQRGGVS